MIKHCGNCKFFTRLYERGFAGISAMKKGICESFDKATESKNHCESWKSRLPQERCPITVLLDNAEKDIACLMKIFEEKG